MVSCFQREVYEVKKKCIEFCIYNLLEIYFFFKFVCGKKKFDINFFDINYMYM